MSSNKLLVCKTFVCGQIKILEFQVLLCWAGDRTTKMSITDGQITTSHLTVKHIGQPAVFSLSLSGHAIPNP
jgi:hypothetical protein